MTPVDQTKTKQLLIDFSRRSIRTDNVILTMQHAQKQGYLAFDEIPILFGSKVVSYLGFNRKLMD
ncbi:hypothetical protein OBA42_02620 [Paracoccaceae bacterium]|nr:hypothetical protein [Paracoccaceae bacterium]MDC3205468.1 hypothetical protein [Paracoccaceae bacterium]